MIKPVEYQININTPEEDIPVLTKECFNWLKDRYGNNLKITDLPDYLRTLTTQKFEDLSDWTPMFVSYIIDLQRKFMGGGNLDMVVFHQDITKAFHLSRLEERFLVKDNFEERLWAIFLAVSKPSQPKFNINNK